MLGASLAACSSQERTVKVVGPPGTAVPPPGAQRPSANDTGTSTRSAVAPNRQSAIVTVLDNPALSNRFSTVTVTLTKPDGTTVKWCVWLADTDELRAQGLQEVTDLGGLDGMLFRFGQQQSTSFWMKGTKLPLSIAFFGSDGVYVSGRDMDPCPDEASAACPVYPAVAPYADAIETIVDGLKDAGVVAGSKLAVGPGGCRPNR